MEHYDEIHEDPELPQRGHVQEVTREWLVRTDAELAERLQNEEVARHLNGNKERNVVVRSDFPTAAAMQSDILERAQNRAMALKEQTDRDAAFAAELQNIEEQRIKVKAKKKLQNQRSLENQLDSAEKSLEACSLAGGPPQKSHSSTQTKLSDREIALQMQKREFDRYDIKSRKNAARNKPHEHLLPDYSQPFDYLEVVSDPEAKEDVDLQQYREPPPPPRVTRDRPRLPEPEDN